MRKPRLHMQPRLEVSDGPADRQGPLSQLATAMLAYMLGRFVGASIAPGIPDPVVCAGRTKGDALVELTELRLIVWRDVDDDTMEARFTDAGLSRARGLFPWLPASWRGDA